MVVCKPARAGRQCVRVFVGIFAVLLGVAEPGTSSAQEEDVAPLSKELEPVTVTGTRMKRVDQEDLQPLVVITREQLDASGKTSIADLLRDLTQNSFGPPTDRNPLGASSSTTVDLRGQGAQYTLVLLNGIPLVGEPSQAGGDIQNLNVLPWAAIDRIEILSDGASAIYGSKAVGGVINIITRQNYDGTAFSVQADHPTRGGAQNRTASMVTGLHGDRSRGMISIDFSDSDPLFAHQRDFLPPSFSPYGAPPTFRRDDPTGGASRAWQPGEGCPAGLGMDPRYPNSRLSPRYPDGSQYCQYNTAADAQEIAALQRRSILAQGSTAISDSLSAHALLLASFNHGRSELAAAPTGTLPNAISPTNPINPTLGEVAPGVGYWLDLRYRPVPAGHRIMETDDRVQQLTAGFTGTRIAGWEADWTVDFVGTHYGQHVDRRNFVSISRLLGAIDSGTFDPFADPSTQDFSLFRVGAYSHAAHRTQGITTQLQPRPLSLFGISLSALVGAEYNHESFSYADDPASLDGDISGWIGQVAAGSRDYRALFGELVANPNGQWQLDAAVRRDDYSDAGGATSPKLSGLWKLGDSLLLRASVGKGFHVPDFVVLGGTQSSVEQLLVDPLGCRLRPEDPVACGEFPREIVSLPNPRLQPETARQINVGMVYSPSRDFSVGLQGFQTRFRNTITSIDWDIVQQNDIACHEAGHPCDMYQQGLVVRDADGEAIRILVPLSVNAAKSLTRGFDVDVRAAHETAIGRFDAMLSYSQITHYEHDFPGGVVDEPLGYINFPRYRANLQLGWKRGDWRASTVAHLTGAQRDCYNDPESDPCEERVPRFVTVDAQVAWNASEKTTLSAGVLNIADRTPYINFMQSYSRGLYSAVGRVIYARLEFRL